jgi:hypothetical protein
VGSKKKATELTTISWLARELGTKLGTNRKPKLTIGAKTKTSPKTQFIQLLVLIFFKLRKHFYFLILKRKLWLDMLLV